MARPRLFVALAFAQAVGAWSLAAGTLQARPMDPRPSPGFQQEQRPAGRADSVTSGLRIQTLEGVHLGSDSVTLVPEVRGEAGAMHRFLFGDLNRDLWTLPITLPVLDLDAVAGGLVPDTAGTAEDTTALRLAGEDGVSYRFHPLFGPVESSIPRPLRRSPVEDVLQDQMAARFPLSRLVVSELMRAAGIPVPHARPVVLPHDPRLGRFAGRTGWFEVALDGREGERRPDPGGLGRARREPPPPPGVPSHHRGDPGAVAEGPPDPGRRQGRSQGPAP